MKIYKNLIVFLSVIIGWVQPVNAEQNTITMVFDATDEIISKGAPSIFINSNNSNSICSDISKNNFKPFELEESRYKELLKDCGEERYISKKDDIVFVRVFYSKSSQKSEIVFTEKKRKTRISSDLTKIFDKLNPLSKYNDAAAMPNTVEAKHILSHERANLSVKVIYSKADSNEKSNYNLNLVTGPEEHWFLSVDLPVINSKILKYDESTTQLVEKDTPSSFYIGVNYMLGDVLSDNVPWNEKLHAKFMLKASSKPLDSIGLA